MEFLSMEVLINILLTSSLFGLISMLFAVLSMRDKESDYSLIAKIINIAGNTKTGKIQVALSVFTTVFKKVFIISSVISFIIVMLM